MQSELSFQSNRGRKGEASEGEKGSMNRDVASQGKGVKNHPIRGYAASRHIVREDWKKKGVVKREKGGG